MKRVLTHATAGVFSMGLMLLPMMANAADPAAAGGKDGKPVAAATATGTTAGTTGGTTGGTVSATHGMTTAAPVKKADDPKVTAVPAAGAGATVTPVVPVVPAHGTTAAGTTAGGTVTGVTPAKPPVKTGS